MVDDVLPIPTPDWDDPTPYDGPTPEEVEAFARLHSTADGIRAWVTGAYLHRPGAVGWDAFADRLAEVVDLCRQIAEDQARTVDPASGQ